MIKHNPKIIIFYDGVNEVFSKCKKENNYFSALREKRIQDLLKKNETNFQIILKPTFKIINFLKRKILRKDTSNNQEKEFDCDINIRKSEDIAKTLVSNWEIVKSISQQNGIKFIPILQPTAFSTKSLTNHLSLNEELKSQYEKVYFQIKKELDLKKINYLNLENSLNKKDYYFIDFCHLSLNGNEIIVDKILSSNLWLDK